MSRNRLYLHQILDAIVKIERYTAVGQREFFAESHWQDAVIRQLQVVGEAAKRVSPELRNRHPTIPWRLMTGTRDVLVHDYDEIELEIVWDVALLELPSLKHSIEAILAADPDI